MINRPDPQAVRSQLNRMLDSRYFRTSPRLRAFLLYTVDQGLAGCEDRLKEYCIALAVFGKPDSFDPRVDSAVRVAARQLRAKIDVYYLNEGINDPVLIRYRPGDYLPRFYLRSEMPIGAFDRIEGRAVIVDKDRATIAAVSECFDTMGVPIGVVVDSGEEAHAALDDAQPAVLITGITLTGPMNGFELTRQVHATHDLPVVMIAPPVTESDFVHQLAWAEPDAIVFKPIRPADVKSAVQLAIARRSAGMEQRPRVSPHLATVA
ncbi:MAG TPA: response regulator [Bryobacteraceae bacterium]|nr:response regulator [Bryobacteraceae bacterium]